jgi:hypothetical protein
VRAPVRGVGTGVCLIESLKTGDVDGARRGAWPLRMPILSISDKPPERRRYGSGMDERDVSKELRERLFVEQCV